MTPQIGQKIIIVLRNNVQLGGIVSSWSNDKSCIKTESGDLIVINKTNEDVIFYKLELPKELHNKAPEQIEDDIGDLELDYEQEDVADDYQGYVAGVPLEETENMSQAPARDKQDIADEFNNISAKRNKTPTDLKTMAQLKEELNLIEKEEISEKLKSHTVTNHSGTKYESPPLSIFAKHTNQKTTPRSAEFNSSLQGLFKKS